MVQRLLICSVGNPGSRYAGTRHSVGHYMIDMLQKHYGLSAFAPLKTKSRPGQVSSGQVMTLPNSPTLTLFKSDSYTNISGRPIGTAIRAILQEPTIDPVVILSDEMDIALGKIKAKSLDSSLGHKGLRDIKKRIAQSTKNITSLRIGIGRPEGNSKDPDIVSHYVLSNFRPDELHVLDTLTFPAVARYIENLLADP